MRKVISILLGLFVVIGIVACGGSDDKKEEKKKEKPVVEPNKPEKPEPKCVPAPGEKC